MPFKHKEPTAIANSLPLVRNPERLNQFPMIEDVRQRAIARLPVPIRGFLECGSGYETCLTRNREAFNAIIITPRYVGNASSPSLATHIFNHDYGVPFGIAPLGTVDLIWPGTEPILRQTASDRHLPYVVGMLGAVTIEEAARDPDHPHWLQVYPLRDSVIFDNIVDRAQKANYDVLVLTIDCPTLGRRESMRRTGFSLPSPQFKSPRFITSCLFYPHWLLRMIQHGMCFCPTFTPYVEQPTRLAISAFIRSQMPVAMSRDQIRRLRDRWPRHLVVKGIVNREEAQELAAMGVDAIWVSNHGGRQLDAAPSSLDALTTIRRTVGESLPLFIDSGVRSGLDVTRAIALGADFVFLGRPFLYGTIAFGENGGDTIVDILTDELLNTLQILGIDHPSTLRKSINPPEINH